MQKKSKNITKQRETEVVAGGSSDLGCLEVLTSLRALQKGGLSQGI